MFLPFSNLINLFGSYDLRSNDQEFSVVLRKRYLSFGFGKNNFIVKTISNL